MIRVNVTELRTMAMRAQARRLGNGTVELTAEELLSLCDRLEHAESELGSRPTLRQLEPVSMDAMRGDVVKAWVEQGHCSPSLADELNGGGFDGNGAPV